MNRSWIAALVAFQMLYASGSFAAETSQPKKFVIVQGKGTTVCEAYLKHLQALPADKTPPRCEFWFDPQRSDFTSPDWEELDVLKNLDLVRKIEVIQEQKLIDQMPRRFLDLPSASQEEWRARFETLIDNGTIQPTLRRAQIPIPDAVTKLLYGYARHSKQCPATTEWVTPQIGVSHYLLNAQGEVSAGFAGRTGMRLPADVFFFFGRPYAFWLAPEEKWHLRIGKVKKFRPEADQFIAVDTCIVEYK
jgi:hypothetical protein